MKAMCLLATTTLALGQSTGPTVPPEVSDRSAPASDQTAHAERSTSDDVPDAPQPNETENKVLTLPWHLVRDQFGMWTSPARARLSDATWLVPLGGFTAALLATDSDLSRHLSDAPDTLLRYRHFADYGLYSMAGGAGGIYLLGLMTHNEHQRETGFLGGEAAIDSLVAVEALKFATARERPFQDNANGRFWHSGSSFPSEHAAGAWAIAGILSHEYPSPFVKFLSYGMATAISASRINAKQHFPSDVLVGAAIGYLTSEYVYRHHHNPTLRGGTWELPTVRPEPPRHWQSKFMGSPYVPLDSWVYPAMDRLSAMGYINSGIAGMRPWTRMECARLVEEALDGIADEDSDESEAGRLSRELATEFSGEVGMLGGGDNAELKLESMYTRSDEVVGRPLTDGYHFGQTEINDFGRPYEQGFNHVSGLSGWAAEGPFAVYVRGEYQHAPSSAALPLAARQVISNVDFAPDVAVGLNPADFPVPPGTRLATINQFRFLDIYVAMNLDNWQLSYGKQSLWWGPEQGGPMMLSDNADPIRMFRVNRVVPFKLPAFLGLLGPMRMEFFVGQFAGYEFLYSPDGLTGTYGQSLHPQPIIHGERISFKPSRKFEVGLSRTTNYGGPGYPLTMHTFLRSLFSTGNALPGNPSKPGDRRSGVDFSYRIHNGVSFYADGFVEDEITPIIAPDVAAWDAGIYIPRLPKIPKLDFRAEGVFTDLPAGGATKQPGFFYYDATWISGYRNDGNLLGSWIGRGGQGAQAWSTYWFTPRSKLQFGFRHQKVSYRFIPNGGTLTDASVRADVWVHSIFSVSTSVQYERWNFPIVAPTKQTNVAASVQLAFWPKGLRHKGSEE